MIADLKVEIVRYQAPEGLCTGTNVMWTQDGRKRSSRLPWVETEAGARRRVEKAAAQEEGRPKWPR